MKELQFFIYWGGLIFGEIKVKIWNCSVFIDHQMINYSVQNDHQFFIYNKPR